MSEIRFLWPPKILLPLKGRLDARKGQAVASAYVDRTYQRLSVLIAQETMAVEKMLHKTRQDVSGCLAAFLTALLLCLDLRMSTRDIVFTGIGVSQGGLVDLARTSGMESPDTSGAVLSAARLLSFLPVATSIAAFVIFFAMSDPRAEKIGKLESSRRALQDALARTDAFFAECGDTEVEILRQIQREEELYTAFLSHISDQVLQIKQKARILLMEKTGTPDAISTLTENTRIIAGTEVHTVQPAPSQNDWYAA